VPVIGSLPLAVVVLVVVITGAAGRVVSTVMVTILELEETRFDTVDVALRLCEPSASAVDGVKVQLPVEVAVAVPNTVVPSYTVTTELASAVPVIGCLLLLVSVPVCGDVITGAKGLIVIVTVAVELAGPSVMV
jgi:hypothetical protein